MKSQINLGGGFLMIAGVFTGLIILGLWPRVGYSLTQQTGSVGLEGTVPANPPTQAPTIAQPFNGQNFSSLPVTVAGLCQSNLLIEVFRNGVFAGSTQCSNNSYSLKIDLFSGRNDLIARAYDTLNQASPDSATISVNFNDSVPRTGPGIALTTNYAKRGANPGTELVWPITLSGGQGPYAVNVDWGDKTSPDLISQPSPGNLNVKHIYVQPGIFSIIIKATDVNGSSAFLQLVGLANGPIQQSNVPQSVTPAVTSSFNRTLLVSIFGLFGLTVITFWLGKRHQLQIIRGRMRRGQRPL